MQNITGKHQKRKRMRLDKTYRSRSWISILILDKFRSESVPWPVPRLNGDSLDWTLLAALQRDEREHKEEKVIPDTSVEHKR